MKIKDPNSDATARQRALLDALGIDYSPDITKGEASKLITEAEDEVMPWECDFYQ